MIPALILSGGKGTRLAQTVPHLPKILAPIQKTPFLQLLIEQLEKSGIFSKIILALGYKASYILDYLQMKPFSIPIEISLESSPMGTGGAILQALDKINTNVFMTLNGDSFFDLPFQKFLDFHQKKQADLSIGCIEMNNASQYGLLEIDSLGRILKFSEKSTAMNGLISAGIYLMQKNLFTTLPLAPCSLEKDLFPRFLEKRAFAFPHTGTFIDIGTALTYREAQNTLIPWICQ